jgi:hypothetical protein
MLPLIIDCFLCLRDKKKFYFEFETFNASKVQLFPCADKLDIHDNALWQFSSFDETIFSLHFSHRSENRIKLKLKKKLYNLNKFKSNFFFYK